MVLFLILVSHMGSTLISALARARNSGYNMTEAPRSKDDRRRGRDADGEVRGRTKVSLSSESDGIPSEDDRGAKKKSKPDDRRKASRRDRRDQRDQDEEYSYTYEDSTPEQEKKELKKDKKKDSRDVRNRDPPRKPSSKRERSKDRVSESHRKIPKQSGKEEEDGMNCPICHKWLKNKYEAWKSHQKASVRCAARRGERLTQGRSVQGVENG